MGQVIGAVGARRITSSAARPAVHPEFVGVSGSPVQALNASGHRALLVDLNNFASFPTLAVGILVASLRNAGFDAQVIVPLAYDVPASVREREESIWHHLQRRIHLSTFRPFLGIRDTLRGVRHLWRNRAHSRVLKEVRVALEDKPDIILLSAYLQHYSTVEAIGKIAREKGVPVLLGGPAFNLPETAEAWRTIPGLAAIVGGEVDLALPEIASAVVGGGDLLSFDGVVLPDGRRSRPAPPLRSLDQSPIPDFSDFPWDRYPVQIIPIMTGRGCQWSRCTFCSDVVSASGRTYRTRSLDSVMSELREQSRRFGTRNFLFLDLKLNSNPAMLRGITQNIQQAVPGAQWIGTVHVDQRSDNGLSRAELKAAVNSGMRRVSFGLESGSQRMLDLMDKGATVEANSSFIRTAHEAGLSIRCTLFKGYPGETAEDLLKTAAFLESHAPYLDRIRFNDFSIIENTPVWESLAVETSTWPGLTVTSKDSRMAKARYRHRETEDKSYRQAKSKVLAAVYAINRRRLRPEAQMFDGLM